MNNGGGGGLKRIEEETVFELSQPPQQWWSLLWVIGVLEGRECTFTTSQEGWRSRCECNKRSRVNPLDFTAWICLPSNIYNCVCIEWLNMPVSVCVCLQRTFYWISCFHLIGVQFWEQHQCLSSYPAQILQLNKKNKNQKYWSMYYLWSCQTLDCEHALMSLCLFVFVHSEELFRSVCCQLWGLSVTVQHGEPTFLFQRD